MYPVTAFEFIMVKLVDHVDMAFLYTTYFPLWLAVSLFFLYKRNIELTNKWTLITGGFLGLLVPVANGFASGNWIWKTICNGQQHILLVDLLWLALGAVSLWVAFCKLGSRKGKLAQPRA